MRKSPLRRPALRQSRTASVYERVVTHIEHAILGRRLRHGDRLPTERDLAAQFRVSRVTVREALRTLQIKGLLNVRKGPTGGYFVKHADYEVLKDGLRTLVVLGELTVEHLAEVRIALEPEIAGVAATRATAEHRRALVGLMKRRTQIKEEGGDVAELDLEFHRLIAVSTRNPLYAALLDSLMKLEFDMVVTQTTFDHTDNAEVDRAHREILEAIMDKDPDAAARAMRHHTLDLKQRKGKLTRQKAS